MQDLMEMINYLVHQLGAALNLQHPAALHQPAGLQELHKLLLEERLAGATLLILANKQDIAGALPPAEIQKVRLGAAHCVWAARL